LDADPERDLPPQVTRGVWAGGDLSRDRVDPEGSPPGGNTAPPRDGAALPGGRTGRNLPAAIGVGLVLGGLAVLTLFTVKATFLLYVGAVLVIALAELTRAFAALSRDEAVDRLHAAGVPAAPARRLAELVADAEVEHWELFDRLAVADTSVLVPGRYVGFSRSEHHESLRPPGVGEHTAAVLAEAGLAEAEIAELVATGAVVQGGPMTYRRQITYR